MAFKGIRIIIDGIDKLSPKIDSPMKKLDKMSQSFAKIGKTLTVGVTLPFLAAGAASVKSAVDINSSMANVATLIPGQTERILELKSGVQQIGIASGKMTDDVAGGLYQVISAFGDSADTAKRLEINVKAAKAGISTTADSINFTGAVTKAYGDISAAAMQKVADLGFQTVKLGVTTFPELASSIGSVTPLAKTMGISLEELFGVMATATGVTGNTAEVSTQFSGILTAMIKPTATMASLFEHLGYASGEAMIKDIGFAKSLETIVSMSKKAGISLGEMFGRKEAMVLALSLTGAQAGDFAAKTKTMTTSAGAMEEAFREQTEGINKAGFMFDQFKVKMVVAGQRIGEKLLPVLIQLGERIMPIVDGFLNMKPEALKLIIIIGGLAATIGPMILIFSQTALSIVALYKALVALPIAFKILSFGVKYFGIALKGLFLNPVGLAVIAIGLLIYNIYLLKKNWTDIADAFSSKFMFLQTLRFFLSDISMTISKIISFIPGLGKIAGFFESIGKGFEFKAKKASIKEFGNPYLSTRGTSAMTGAGGTVGEKKSEVLVKFENAPKGMRVENVKSGSVDLQTDVGSIFSGAF